MIFGKRQDPDVSELLQITPMVDMVFTLLAFFIMATHIAMPERELDMAHQNAQFAAGAHAEDFPLNVPVRLMAGEAGVRIVIEQVALRDNDFPALRAHLTQINMPQIPVLVLAEPALSVAQVSQALDAVLASPMKKVTLASLTDQRAKPQEAALAPR